jgi:hypothetical protein
MAYVYSSFLLTVKKQCLHGPSLQALFQKKNFNLVINANLVSNEYANRREY